MAALTYGSDDLEVVATRVLFGPRGDRLDVLNVFRVQGSENPVEYLVNAQVASQEAVDTALDNISNDSTGATGDVTLDSVDLEVVFRHALVSGRSHRLDLINLFRAIQDADPVEYLVNARNPLEGEFQTALANVASAA